jgi:hypothetical protein
VGPAVRLQDHPAAGGEVSIPGRFDIRPVARAVRTVAERAADPRPLGIERHAAIWALFPARAPEGDWLQIAIVKAIASGMPL